MTITDPEIQAAILRGLAKYPEVQADVLALNVYSSPGWHTAPSAAIDTAELAALVPRVQAAQAALVAAGKLSVDARGFARST